MGETMKAPTQFLTNEKGEKIAENADKLRHPQPAKRLLAEYVL